jgi:hypothetical protein
VNHRELVDDFLDMLDSLDGFPLSNPATLNVNLRIRLGTQHEEMLTAWLFASCWPPDESVDLSTKVARAESVVS